MASQPLRGSGKKRSVSRDLTLALILTVAVIATTAVSLAYLNSLGRAKAQLEAKADEYIHSLERLVELPLWNVDEEAVKKVGGAYSHNQLVDGLVISDAYGKVFYNSGKSADLNSILRSVDVYSGKTLVGHVTLSLTSQPYISANRHLFWVSIGTILVIIIVLVVATTFFLRLFLRTPLKWVGGIVDSFASGHYDATEDEMPYVEFKPLVGVLGEMGKKITSQLALLRESRDELEVRVEERTKELAESNNSLRMEVQQRIRMGEDLRKAHTEAENLLASLSSFLIGVSPDLLIRRWNSAAESTFGKLSAQVIAKNLAEVAIGWDWEALIKGVPGWPKLEHSVHFADVPYQRPDQQSGFLSVTISPLKTETGQPDGFLFLGMDITERRNLELQLGLARKLESVGQLAAGIAHEINTPIQYVGDNLRFVEGAFEDLKILILQYEKLTAAIRGNAFEPAMLDELEALSRQTDFAYLSSEIPIATEQSIEGVKRVASIVQAMKEFSHPGGKEKIPVDINRAIQTTLTVARNEWKYVAEVETELEVNLPLVPCLPDELNQVILNLVVNAAHAIGDVVKANPTGKGVIRVITKMVNEDWVEVRIADTGPGIPENIRHRIFEPFFTTKEVGRGTGQGLAIARSTIVKKHGGQLSFETSLGEGTTFIIRLPISSIQIAEK